ncbi:hypothetical protein [Rubripirellula tenax]|nr:hypothetical protein [Rubripirellula tenax]
MDDPDLTSSSGTFRFSYKTYWDHIQGVFSEPNGIVGFAFATFGSLWTVFEGYASTLSPSPNRLIPYVAFLFVSVMAAVGWRVYHYLRECPEGLESLPANSYRIAHLQRSMWEFHFAKSLLAVLLGPIDREARDLADGKVFVPAESPQNFRAYHAWLSSRPTNLIEMVEVAKRLLVQDFPRAIQSTEEKAADPKLILDVCVAIQRVYAEAVAFERASRSLLPPERCERLHELQQGWSEPVRDATHQLFEILQSICDVDPNADSQLSFTIEFGELPQVDDFCDELSRLESQLPAILSEEW